MPDEDTSINQRLDELRQRLDKLERLVDALVKDQIASRRESSGLPPTSPEPSRPTRSPTWPQWSEPSADRSHPCHSSATCGTRRVG